MGFSVVAKIKGVAIFGQVSIVHRSDQKMTKMLKAKNFMLHAVYLAPPNLKSKNQKWVSNDITV
jgi:hypothetical protein